MRESTVESYLDTEVTKAGGITRKFLGRTNNPDRIIIWPAATKYGRSAIVFVECKAPGKRPRPGQRREIIRLRKLGCNAIVIDTRALVDAFISNWRTL